MPYDSHPAAGRMRELDRATDPDDIARGGIHAALARLRAEVDAQGELVEALIVRLDPIRRCCPSPAPADDPAEMPPGSPVAGAILEAVHRLAALRDRLRDLLEEVDL